MKRLMIALAGALAILVGVAGCAGLDATDGTDARRLAYQYATLRAIEKSDSLTGADLIEHVERYREMVTDPEVTHAEIRGALAEHGSIADMPASRQLLMLEVTRMVENALGEDSEPLSLLNDEQRQFILTRLDWITEAASMVE